MSITLPIPVFICGTCNRGFLSEDGIRAHQDHWTALHALDPELPEHDGTPWTFDHIEVGRMYQWHSPGQVLPEEFKVLEINEERVTYEHKRRSPGGRPLDRWDRADFTFEKMVAGVWPGDTGDREATCRRQLAEAELGQHELEEPPWSLELLGALEARRARRASEATLALLTKKGVS